MIFRKDSAQPGHVINLSFNLFEDMRNDNVVSNLIGNDSSAGTHAYVKRSSSGNITRDRHLMVG